MASSSPSCFGSAMAVLVLVMFVGSAAGTPDTEFVYSAYNTQKFKTDAEKIVENSTSADLKQHTASNGYDYKTITLILLLPPGYGQAICKILQSLLLIALPAFLSLSIASRAIAATPSVFEFNSLTVSFATRSTTSSINYSTALRNTLPSNISI